MISLFAISIAFGLVFSVSTLAVSFLARRAPASRICDCDERSSAGQIRCVRNNAPSDGVAFRPNRPNGVDHLCAACIQTASGQKTDFLLNSSEI